MNEKIYYVAQKSNDKKICDVQMCGITYPDKNYEIRRGNSHVFCIEYIEKGTGTVHIGNDTFYPEEGDAYLLTSGMSHHYYSDRDNPWQKVFINIRGELFEAFIDGYGLKNHHHFRRLDIKKELYSVIDLANSSSDDCTEDIICIVNRILYKMMNSVRNKKSVSSVAEKIKDYLSSHVTSRFSMEELCSYISRSESQTIRIFKQAYATTPYAYILGKKIALAKDMLINTNLSVKQIAYTLKFTDEYYFSNVFKSKTGVSPSVYRKGAE